MTASLPEDVQEIFARFITTEYTTVDALGQPITWPVTPYYERGGETIDVSTGLGYPKKANDARANPNVSLLFSDPTGSGLDAPATVLVQGTAEVDDDDLDRNRDRYARESKAKLPGAPTVPGYLQGLMTWYFARIYVRVRPERVYVWAEGDASSEPALYDSHMEEVRSAQSEQPAARHAQTDGGAPTWDARMDELGRRYRSAVLSVVAPDGFPFSVRVAADVDARRRRVRLPSIPAGMPITAGLACLTAHDHAPDFAWQRNFQVRGDLVADDDGWALVPHRLIGGFELPPGSPVTRLRLNLGRMRRFRSNANRELARRRAQRATVR